MLHLSLLGPAVQITVASLARSYKEAQTYVGYTMMVPMACIPLLPLTGAEPALWKLIVPILGQHVVITGILGGDPFDPASFALAELETVAWACVFLFIAARNYQRENIIFN